MYEVAERIKVQRSGTSLGDIYDPYFDRSARQFSGHVNTPSQPDPSGYDAGSEKGGFLYLAHPIFTAYKRIGAVAMLEIAEKLIERALGTRRLIETSLPRAGRATLRRQAERKRDVLHLLHATPALRGNIRGDNVQPIQDLVTLHDIAVSVAAEGKVRSGEAGPVGRAADVHAEGGPGGVHGAEADRAPDGGDRVTEASRDAVGWAKGASAVPTRDDPHVRRSRVGAALARL